MSIENPEHAPKSGGKETGKPLTTEELKAIEQIYRVSGVEQRALPKDNGEKITLDAHGNLIQAPETALRLEIADEADEEPREGDEALIAKMNNSAEGEELTDEMLAAYFRSPEYKKAAAELDVKEAQFRKAMEAVGSNKTMTDVMVEKVLKRIRGQEDVSAPDIPLEEYKDTLDTLNTIGGEDAEAIKDLIRGMEVSESMAARLRNLKKEKGE
jgi:hypothetical protein